MRVSSWLALASVLFAAPLAAAELNVSVQLPQIDVAEYHRPYVALWIEDEKRNVAANLAALYQQDKPGADGTPPKGEKWLPDLRQWWRRSGRNLKTPIDGVSSATLPVGEHALSFTVGQTPLTELAAGSYSLMIEAVREEGGRELLSIPFTWPAGTAQSLSAQGKTELGAVHLQLKP